MMKERLRKLYPPGYEWREELISAAILFGLAFLLSWQYLFRLGHMTQDLYTYDRYGKRLLRPDALAEAFSNLTVKHYLFGSPKSADYPYKFLFVHFKLN